MREKQITLLVSSDGNAGAEVSSDGSYFDVHFQEHLRIPPHAENCQLEMHSATIWWTIPNISAALGNNLFYYEWTGASGNDNFVIPDGLYNLADLNATLNREILILTGESNMITLYGDDATQKVVITYNKVGFAIDFTQANTPREILGFNSRWSPLVHPTVAITSDNADSIAAFNTVEHFLIHSDLVDNGMLINNNYSQTIGKVPITVHPGSQIVYEPSNPVHIDCDEMIGRTLSHLSFWLTDQAGNRVDTHGEIWTCVIVIRYLV